MSGHRIGADFLAGFSGGGSLHVGDPGAGNTFVIDHSHQICEVDTAGAEGRVLPDPEGFPVGTEFTVILNTDGGDLTVTVDAGITADDIDPAGNTTVTFDNPGDLCTFLLVRETDVKMWHYKSHNGCTFG